MNVIDCSLLRMQMAMHFIDLYHIDSCKIKHLLQHRVSDSGFPTTVRRVRMAGR